MVLKVKKSAVPETLIDGYHTLLKNCSKEGQPGRYSGQYRKQVLDKLQQENPQLHAAVVKKLGDT